MLAMVAASFAVDALLLLGLSWADAIPGEVATLYALAGGLSCVAFYVVMGSRWCERSSDHYLVVPLMLLATAINLFFVAWAPQIGGLLLMVLFIVFAFGALRMSARRTIVGAALVSLLVGDMRATDRLGRYGGEEFLMLLTATSDLATATHAADRVREGVAQADWGQIAPGLAVTTSIELTICEADESIERMIHRSDEALYEAKRAGRNRVRAG